MPATHCGRYVLRAMPMTTTNTSTERTTRIRHMRIVRRLLLLLARCAEHSWSSANVGSQAAICRRSSRERGHDGLVVAWSSNRSKSPINQFR